ncbi:TPA: hypothetical protein DEP34_03455 [Candidatus Uhrbacteria bacterium]|uniref:Uncharacterized protein n=2 Tax=Candidatus Uhriibacteriota TaxID=1752732 RepID=A0A0G1Q8D2_9BACT|nr:MAG: hypothetical protein UX45_C0009G0009 [Candidatus Uhrbacteria bacterium GW2011_GWF2_46_218]KKU41306.1 MAG: hypothetical protein UX57_C0004G0010 [Candidatus Uhrbacteria bacterium GW2011_GWE2_46_68]HBK33743.1 hypothetical protein [Candidatus Uhrbacteria bacterium]HCB19416.1 hypothetical protein [Candidatus Uhrbacteria bacterium]
MCQLDRWIYTDGFGQLVKNNFVENLKKNRSPHEAKGPRGVAKETDSRLPVDATSEAAIQIIPAFGQINGVIQTGDLTPNDADVCGHEWVGPPWEDIDMGILSGLGDDRCRGHGVGPETGPTVQSLLLVSAVAPGAVPLAASEHFVRVLEGQNECIVQGDLAGELEAHAHEVAESLVVVRVQPVRLCTIGERKPHVRQGHREGGSKRLENFGVLSREIANLGAGVDVITTRVVTRIPDDHVAGMKTGDDLGRDILGGERLGNGHGHDDGKYEEKDAVHGFSPWCTACK